MKIIRNTDWTKQLATLTTASAIAVAPFLSAPATVEAAPRRFPGAGRNNAQTTLTGTVTRDLGGDQFNFRADNGRTYRVRVGRFDEPRSLDRGDRVRVTGQLRNNVFVARNIEFLRDTPVNDDNYNGQRTLTGIVTRDLGGDNFELRTEDGRTHRVRVGRFDEPRSLEHGDHVRVTGRFTGSLFLASNLEFLRDTDDDNNGQTTLTGTVTRDLGGDQFNFRADNGRTYRVRVGRFDEPRSLDRGDRVRVTGQLRNNVFVARNIEFLRDTGR